MIFMVGWKVGYKNNKRKKRQTGKTGLSVGFSNFIRSCLQGVSVESCCIGTSCRGGTITNNHSSTYRPSSPPENRIIAVSGEFSVTLCVLRNNNIVSRV